MDREVEAGVGGCGRKEGGSKGKGVVRRREGDGREWLGQQMAVIVSNLALFLCELLTQLLQARSLLRMSFPLRVLLFGHY